MAYAARSDSSSAQFDHGGFSFYSETCVRKPPLKLTLVVDVERWLSYKGKCHVILLAKLHDIYLYDRQLFPHQPLFKVSLKGGSLTQVSLY